MMAFSYRVSCSDGQVRHVEPFASRSEACKWAEACSRCSGDHTVEALACELKSLGQSQYELLAAIKRCQSAERDAQDMLLIHAENMTRSVNRFVAAAREAVEVLNTLTTDDFAKGGDRPARHALIEALGMVGACSEEEAREYGIVRLS